MSKKHLKAQYLQALQQGDITKANQLLALMNKPDPLQTNTAPDGSVRLRFLIDDEPVPAPEPGLNVVRIRINNSKQ
ncbi:hypothetical protein A8C56_23540 [Niabella ginsenosidivorans]|uniref:Uncharacterized protein n=1 Tax=Niabella ginsenosidivorans TaxID=1176587 RepID=A0A1A9I916_9BACT|nr:hypothetical protein [Niabella ginsenosidivorans]ANH83549.1 hypothetical protein A8C56_23540 [Niabella ginsenosidivorans]